jgi:hypothetical protein
MVAERHASEVAASIQAIIIRSPRAKPMPIASDAASTFCTHTHKPLVSHTRLLIYPSIHQPVCQPVYHPHHSTPLLRPIRKHLIRVLPLLDKRQELGLARDVFLQHLGHIETLSGLVVFEDAA